MSINTPKRKKTSVYLTQEIIDELDLVCQEEGGEDRSVIIRHAIMHFLKKARVKRQAITELLHNS